MKENETKILYSPVPNHTMYVLVYRYNVIVSTHTYNYTTTQTVYCSPLFFLNCTLEKRGTPLQEEYKMKEIIRENVKGIKKGKVQ